MSQHLPTIESRLRQVWKKASHYLDILKYRSWSHAIIQAPTREEVINVKSLMCKGESEGQFKYLKPAKT